MEIHSHSTGNGQSAELNTTGNVLVNTGETNANRRVVNTKQQLERLIMDVTSHDLNLQMQQLVADYKKTGDEHFKIDAEYLRSEFDTWWNDEVSMFAPPAAV